MRVYAWLIDFAHFRENCPTGIITEWMQKVTQPERDDTVFDIFMHNMLFWI